MKRPQQVNYPSFPALILEPTRFSAVWTTCGLSHPIPSRSSQAPGKSNLLIVARLTRLWNAWPWKVKSMTPCIVIVYHKKRSTSTSCGDGSLMHCQIAQKHPKNTQKRRWRPFNHSFVCRRWNHSFCSTSFWPHLGADRCVFCFQGMRCASEYFFRVAFSASVRGNIGSRCWRNGVPRKLGFKLNTPHLKR